MQSSSVTTTTTTTTSTGGTATNTATMVHDQLPTVEDEKTRGDTNAAHRETGESSSGHREHDFIEKFEHQAPGYGNERGKPAIDDLADEDNPNVHEHVRL